MSWVNKVKNKQESFVVKETATKVTGFRTIMMQSRGDEEEKKKVKRLTVMRAQTIGERKSLLNDAVCGD